jgi:hypothetical protein
MVGWRRPSLGDRRSTPASAQVVEGPFAGDGHPLGMHTPSFPFLLLCEIDSNPKVYLAILFLDLIKLQVFIYMYCAVRSY